MSAKVSNDFSPPIRKGSCRLSSCVIVCLHCVIANRRSVMSCRRLPTRLMIASHSCAWQRLSQHSLLACAARRKRLVSLNARKSCDSWLKTSWLARISSPFVTAFRSLQVCPKTEDPTAQTAKITFCVSGVISPILANLYLHHALDLWVDAWRKKRARGDVIIVRYADDAVLGFERREDAEQFLEQLRERLAKFGLELHPEKTRLIEFGRFAAERRKRRGEGKPETFHFLTSVGRTTRRANSRSTGKRSANAWQPSSKIFERNCASGCTSACRKPGSGCSKWCVGISNIMPFREILRGCERFAVTCYGAGYRRYGAEARTIA